MLNLSQVYAYWTEITEQLIIWRWCLEQNKPSSSPSNHLRWYSQRAGYYRSHGSTRVDMLNFLFKAKPRKDGSKNVVNETGFRRNTRIKMRSFCRFCRFAFANHSDVRFFHYFGTSRFTTRTEDHWRSRFLQSRCRRILTHLQIIQSPSSQCSSSSQELQRESPPRPVGTEQAQRICQQVKSASFKDFGSPGLPIFLRSPFAFHFLCQFSSLLLPFVFDLIQEFPFCSERLGLLASNPSRQHEVTDPASKFEVDEVCEKVLGWFQLQGFFFESFLPPAPPRQMMQPPSPRTIFHDGTRHCHMTSHLQVISSFTAVSW